MPDLPDAVLLEAGLILDKRFTPENQPRKPGWIQPWRPSTYAQHAHQKGDLRQQIEKRDKGVCAACRRRCNELWEAIEFVKLCLQSYRPGYDFHFSQFKTAVGLDLCKRWPKSLWDADMIIPKSQGGQETLENMRTLCLRCHRQITNRVIYGHR